MKTIYNKRWTYQVSSAVLTSTVSPIKYLSLVKVKTSSARSPNDDLWVKDAKYNTGITNCVNIKKQYINYRNLAVITHRKTFLVSHTSVACSGRVINPFCGSSDCWQDKHTNSHNTLPIKLPRTHQCFKCFLLLRTHYWCLPKEAIIQMLESFSLKRVNLNLDLSTILYAYFYKVIWCSCCRI